MVPVSPLRGSNGDERDEEVERLVGDFSGDTLLEDINFGDLFMGFDDGDKLPELEVDPAEIFAELPEGREEDSSGMAVAAESTVGSDGGGQQKGLLEGEMKVEEDLSQREGFMSETTKEDLVAMTAEIRSPSSEVNRDRKSSGVAAKNSQGKRKVKVDWTPELHRRFVQAVEQLGVDKAVPSRILELMGVDCLTRHNVASHLQKYRSRRKHVLAREAEAVSWSQRRQKDAASGACARRNMNPWLAPIIGFPPPPPPPVQPFRPLHVWGHPTVDPPLLPMWPRNLASWSPTPPWAPQPSLPPLPNPSCWHHHYQRGSREGWVPYVLTQGTPCLPQTLPTSFPAPPVPGVLPHPFYRPFPTLATGHWGSQLLDAYPEGFRVPKPRPLSAGRSQRNGRGDMASSIGDGSLFLLLALLFPLHLLYLRRRLLRRSGDGRYLLLRYGALLASVAVLLSAGLSNLEGSSRNDALVSELEEMKLKIARLESVLEENTKILNSKTLHREEKNKLLGEMEYKIQLLQNALHDIKKSPSDSSYSEDRITTMEEEVQLLWNESRENNFKIHTLESLVHDAEEEMKAVASEVDKTKNIVTEQWIQIRQLEQAFQSTKIMASNVRKRIKSEDYNEIARHIKCAIMKVVRFIKGIHHGYSPETVGLPDSFFLAGSFSKSFISQAYNQLKKIMSFALKCHNELQDVVKDAMEMNKFTAPLAHKEVAFLVAYAIMTFPILSVWIFCSSCFG